MAITHLRKLFQVLRFNANLQREKSLLNPYVTSPAPVSSRNKVVMIENKQKNLLRVIGQRTVILEKSRNTLKLKIAGT